MTGFMKKLILGFMLMCGVLHAAPANDGMYATLQTTMGDICFELYYTNVPHTVASFVSLAEGTRSWLDPRDGFVSRDPFYSDIIFHRVITNFMIQCGSPKGNGKDGPGYRFDDEFDPTLRHDQPGIVSMANSGPDSNGSQFFITVTDTSWLDDEYSVFGKVVEGMDVVFNIAAVAVDGSDRPLVDVVITNAFITRNGTHALAFDSAGVVPALPVVRPATSHLYMIADQWVLDWEEHANCVYWVFASDKVDSRSGWLDLLVLLDFEPPVNWQGMYVTGIFNNNPRAFFNVTEVLYSE